MRYTLSVVGALTILFATSCSSTLKMANGSSDNRPLLFEDEYDVAKLPELEVEGAAFFGIPSFSKNNQNKRSRGVVLYLNGVESRHISRSIPILTLLGTSLATGLLIQEVGGYRDARSTNFTGQFREYSIPLIPACIIGLPIAGMINNLVWSNAAFSGASNSLNYRLVDENPGTDIFFYPRYTTVKNKDGFKLKYLWTQDASVKLNLWGGQLRPTGAPKK
jgi:hypothetical protein